MKKFLPVLVLFLFGFFFFFYTPSFAQTVPLPTSSAPTLDTGPISGTWVPDPDVTFAGKMASRSASLLNIVLRYPQWLFIGEGEKNPLSTFWLTISGVVYAFFALFVLISAFVMIITRGRSITIMRFIPRFIIIIILVTLSFAIVQFIYQITDILQLIFLKNATGPVISRRDLLNIAFDYRNFVGFRLKGDIYDESAFVSIILVKLTAVTFYVMSGLLILRKIILWFFITISPVFPLLLLYYPVRNTAKIWIGEFFRWLLYGPLFAIFLSGVVAMWASPTGIPLKFDFAGSNGGEIIYPTAINILLGGPGQKVSITNSINTPDTFTLYVVALLMLWVVIILPFILLQIFLDYLKNITPDNNVVLRQLMNGGTALMQKFPQPTPPPQTPPKGIARPFPLTPEPLKPQSTGLARQLPTARPVNISRSVPLENSVLRAANLSIPTIRDIARYETSTLSTNIQRHEEVAKVHETLERIANPARISTPNERNQYTALRQQLVTESKKGNSVASSILSAAHTVSKSNTTLQSHSVSQALTKIANPATLSAAEKTTYTALRQQLLAESQKGNKLATDVLSASQNPSVPEAQSEKLKEQLLEAKEKKDMLATSILDAMEKDAMPSTAPASSFPVFNRVQSVSLDDYESVKKMWGENYEKLDPPHQMDRKQWIKEDMDKINQTIALLTTADKQKSKQGMEMVGNILPFLLIGGFSQTEVIAYLKAKYEAGKQTLSQLDKKQDEEDTKLDTTKKTETTQKEMHAEVEEQKPPVPPATSEQNK